MGEIGVSLHNRPLPIVQPCPLENFNPPCRLIFRGLPLSASPLPLRGLLPPPFPLPFVAGILGLLTSITGPLSGFSVALESLSGAGGRLPPPVPSHTPNRGELTRGDGSPST